MRAREPVLAPSLLAADFAAAGAEAAAMRAAGATWLHLDVMDGHFVPNLTFGPGLVRALRGHSDALFDVHLMTAPASPLIEPFAQAGADRLTVHVEAENHLHRSLQAIRAAGCRAGVALNPATPADAVAEVLDLVDLVLVMTVNPGFGGQSFLAGQLDKIARLRALLDRRAADIHLQADGGVNADTAPRCAAAGADVLVAGTSLFRGGAQGGAEAYRANLAELGRRIAAGA